MSMFEILSIVILLGFLVVSIYVYHRYKSIKCTEGPAFWCANPQNWKLCTEHNKKNSYADYCCKDNKTWMAKTDTKDPDPNTNGFNKYCK